MISEEIDKSIRGNRVFKYGGRERAQPHAYFHDARGSV